MTFMDNISIVLLEIRFLMINLHPTVLNHDVNFLVYVSGYFYDTIQ